MYTVKTGTILKVFILMVLHSTQNISGLNVAVGKNYIERQQNC